MLNIAIEKMTYGIDALGHHEGKVVFIPYESSNLIGSLKIIKEFFEDRPENKIKDSTSEIIN